MSRREDVTPEAPIEAYHALLAGSAGERLAADTHEALEAQLARRGLVFGDRALCTVLRPRFYRPSTFRLLETRVRPLMRAFGLVSVEITTASSGGGLSIPGLAPDVADRLVQELALRAGIEEGT